MESSNPAWTDDMQRLALIALAALASACTFDLGSGNARQEQQEPEASESLTAVAGRLFYPERIALPSNAVLQLRVEKFDAAGRRNIAEYRRSLSGEQVPLPIALSFERSRGAGILHELRAQVFQQGTILRDTGPVLLDPGSDHIDLGRVRLHPSEAGDVGRSWQCGNRLLQFAADAGRGLLIDDGRRIELEQVRTASGVRYQSGDDESVWVHEKDGNYLFSLSGNALEDCRPREETTVPVEARGNEPGWHLELGRRRAELDYDYGEATVSLPLIDAESQGRNLYFRAAGKDGALVAVFHDELCRDTATGMPHPWRVRVQTGKRRFEGCGGRPHELLVGTEWVVERLDGDTLDLGTGRDPMTLRFNDEDRLSGYSACNHYSAGYTLSGEGLTIERPGSTLMACPPETMELEKRFFDLLTTTRRFEIDSRGRLVLIADGGRLLAREDKQN